MSVAPGVADFLAARADNNGHLGTIEVLPIEQLRIDPRYQRDLVQKLVDEIALAYDPLTAGVVLVSRRESGDLFIVDGQHKSAGAKQAGNASVLSLVVNGLTQEDEARLRLAANVKRADTHLEKFKARLAAGEPQALAIEAIVAQYDVKINHSPIGSTGINATGALDTVFAIDDTGIMLTRVLDLVQDAFGAPEGEKAHSPILKGFAFFLRQHGNEVDRARLVERLQIEGVAALRRMAINHRAALGGSLWLNVYRATVEVYNFRLGDASKLEWRTGGWSTLSFGKDRESGN